MNINSVTVAGKASFHNANTKAPARPAAKDSKSDGGQGVVLELTQQPPEEAATYKKPVQQKEEKGLSADTLKQMKEELSRQQTDTFIRMVRDIMQRQHIGMQQAVSEILQNKAIATPERIQQAQQDIAEGGQWSVKATSERILNFAKAVADNDPAKAEMLKQAFLEGYEQAEKAWGGALPEICKQTKEAVLEGFGQWEGQSQTEEI